MASWFRQGMQPGMFGSAMLGVSTPQNGEGLGMPNGQAMFNLPRTSVPGTDVNMGGGVVGGFGAPSLKMSITRSASSDPVQNIINDISNPLSGTTANVAPAAKKPGTRQIAAQDAQNLMDNWAGGFSPWLHDQTITTPGQQLGQQFLPTSPRPGQSLPGMMQAAGLKERLMNPSNLSPFIFL